VWGELQTAKGINNERLLLPHKRIRKRRRIKNEARNTTGSISKGWLTSGTLKLLIVLCYLSKLGPAVDRLCGLVVRVSAC
jgi:hypothetical protein